MPCPATLATRLSPARAAADGACPRASQVRFAETRSSFLHFVTSVCAIVGGVFTVSGIIDSGLYHGTRVLRKKMELGKHN